LREDGERREEYISILFLGEASYVIQCLCVGLKEK